MWTVPLTQTPSINTIEIVIVLDVFISFQTVIHFCLSNIGAILYAIYFSMFNSVGVLVPDVLYIAVTGMASKMQHQPAELLWGVLEITCIIHILFQGFKAWSMILMHARVDMCVCVFAYLCLCNSYCVYLSLCGFGNNVTFITFVSASLMSSLICILVQVSLLFVLTIQRGKHKHTVNCYPSVCIFLYLHESSCMQKYYWQAESCVAFKTPFINLMWTACEVMSTLL